MHSIRLVDRLTSPHLVCTLDSFICCEWLVKQFNGSTAIRRGSTRECLASNTMLGCIDKCFHGDFVCLSFYNCLSLCIYMYVCLLVCLSVCICTSVCLPLYICLSVCLSLYICLYDCLSVWPSVSVCLSMSVCQFVCPSMSVCTYIWLCLSVSVYLSFCLSAFLSVCRSICLSPHRSSVCLSPYRPLSLSISACLSACRWKLRILL